MPDDLLDFGFGSLEKKAIEENMNLKKLKIKLVFYCL
jgi:hypothetical protein